METEILIALIGKMVDERLSANLPVSIKRGPRGFTGRDGKDFSLEECDEYFREVAKSYALNFDDLTDTQKESLRGQVGRSGCDGRDGKDFSFAEHEATIREWAKEFAFRFEDLSNDQIETIRGPRGRDGRHGSDGRSFIYEENRDSIESTIRSVVTELRPQLKLKFEDLSQQEIAEFRGPRGRDGRDGKDFIFEEYLEYFETLKLKFSDLSDDEKETLRLKFSNLTEEERDSLKLKFSDLSDGDRLLLRGPRGLRGQRGSRGVDGNTGRQGPRGLPGPQGIRGLTGYGISGTDGKDGKDAPYVTSIEVDEYGDEILFIFDFSDGTSIRTDRIALPAPVHIYGAGGSSGGGKVKMDYETIVDEADSTTTYVGYATPGSTTDVARWKIKRIQVVGLETIIEYADSNAFFDNVWDSRASLSYG